MSVPILKAGESCFHIETPSIGLTHNNTGNLVIRNIKKFDTCQT